MTDHNWPEIIILTYMCATSDMISYNIALVFSDFKLYEKNEYYLA